MIKGDAYVALREDSGMAGRISIHYMATLTGTSVSY
jgi:hypothetical protein